jgi:hypothetical protein
MTKDLSGDSKAPPIAGFRFSPVWLLFLCAMPLWALWLTYAYTVDVPYWDAWDSTWPIFQKFHAGTLALGDFLAFQNEHRVCFPRIVGFLLGLVSHWNIRVEAFGSWVLACASALNLWRLARVTGGTRFGWWLPVGLTFLLFSPVQYETWLLGASAFEFPVVCLTASLWIPLTATPLAFLWAMALATIATFSIASGFLVWIVVTPILALSMDWKRHHAGWTLWIAAFLLNVIFYFHGYQKPERSPSAALFIHQPLMTAKFALAYLGADFALDTFNATIVGTFLTVVFFGCIVILWRRRADRSLVVRALPWTMLAAFAFANAALTAIGRIGFGVEEALSTRYIAISILLPISLLYLAPALLIDVPEERFLGASRCLRAAVICFFAVALAGLQIAASVGISGICVEMQHLRLKGKAALTFIDVLPNLPVLKTVSYEDVALLRKKADAVDGFGYLRPGLLKSLAIRALADPSSPGDPRYGQFTDAGAAGPSAWKASGIAQLPEAGRPADAILLTCDDGRNDPVIFAFAKMKLPTVAWNGAIEETTTDARWFARITQSQVPAAAKTIKAWAYNAETGCAHRLQGEIPLTSSTGNIPAN